MASHAFRFKADTLKRCKITECDDKQITRFSTLNLELFPYLYQVSKIDFSIFFRAGNTIVEFIKPSEFSKELLDEVWQAMQRPVDGVFACIQKTDRPSFDQIINKIRSQKIDDLAKRTPHLDRKTLDLYANLSNTSQMIVTGGIDRDVAQSVKASAAYLVSNQLDSEAAIDTLSRMITCDPTLYDHSATVAMIATVIATKHLKKTPHSSEIQTIAQCALYHDVGKTCVPNAILNKPGRLTPEEFEVMKTHTTQGEAELKTAIENGVPISAEVMRVAYEHHEKFCGGGYPCGKKGRFEDDPKNGIHPYSRIVTIADIYSALLMKRVYKEAFAPQDALKIMAESAKDLDPEIFPAFLRAVVSSLNMQQKKLQGKGRILQLDEGGKLQEFKKAN